MRKRNLSGAALAVRAVLLIASFFATNLIASGQTLLAAHTETHAPAYFSGQPDAESSLSLWTRLKPQKQLAPYIPITPRQRLRWFLTNTVGPAPLAGGIFSAAVGTALDRPAEYGPHWGGFGDRYGIRMTGIVPQNAIEAGFGMVLGEDPRYFSARGLPFKARLGNVIRLTFVARRTDGSYGPAFARYAAISGNNLLSNAWRVQSETSAENTLIRIAGGFAGRMASNAFEEFWPSVKDHVFKRL